MFRGDRLVFSEYFFVAKGCGVCSKICDLCFIMIGYCSGVCCVCSWPNLMLQAYCRFVPGFFVYVAHGLGLCSRVLCVCSRSNLLLQLILLCVASNFVYVAQGLGLCSEFCAICSGFAPFCSNQTLMLQWSFCVLRYFSFMLQKQQASVAFHPVQKLAPGNP
jgi:hypothetical protein